MAKKTVPITESLPTPPELQTWALDKLLPAEDNARAELRDIDELAESIRAVGLLQPIVATTTIETAETGELVIVAGHRRHAACIAAGLTEVPVLVHQAWDDQMRRSAILVENLHRDDLTPIERARGFAQLSALGLNQREIALSVGVSQPTVSRALSLLELPEKAQGWVDAGTLSTEHAVRIAALPAEARKELVDDRKPGASSISEWEITRAEGKAKEAVVEARLRKEAKDRGLTIIERGAWDEFENLETLGDLEWVDADDHESLPCHAVMIRTYGTEALVPYCTDSSLHPMPEGWGGEDGEGDDSGDRRTPQENAAQRERRERRDRVAALMEPVVTASTEALSASKKVVDTVLAFAVPVLLGSDTLWDGTKAAAELLGLTIEKGWPQPRDLLPATVDGATALRTLHALALADSHSALEEVLDGAFAGEDSGADWIDPTDALLAHLRTVAGFENEEIATLVEQARQLASTVDGELDGEDEPLPGEVCVFPVFTGGVEVSCKSCGEIGTAEDMEEGRSSAQAHLDEQHEGRGEIIEPEDEDDQEELAEGVAEILDEEDELGDEEMAEGPHVAGTEATSAEDPAYEDEEDATQQGAGDDGPDPDGDASEAGDGADSHDVGPSGPEPAPTITIEDQVKKGRSVYKVTCSTCGVLGRVPSTTHQYATQKGSDHLWEVHGIEAPAVEPEQPGILEVVVEDTGEGDLPWTVDCSECGTVSRQRDQEDAHTRATRHIDSKHDAAGVVVERQKAVA